MRDQISNGNGNGQSPRLPIESPAGDEHRFEVRFGIPHLAEGAPLGGNVRWARPGGTWGDEARRHHGEEARRWAVLPDGRRSQLRSLLMRLDTAVVRLRPSGEAAAMRELDGAVASLAEVLDSFGPEPTVVSCPVCARLGMAGATVCGFCWTALTAAS